MKSTPVPPPDGNVRYDQYGFIVPPKPPRPVAVLGAVLLMVGGALHILGVFLPWYQGSGVASLKGMDSFYTVDGNGFIDAPGKVWLVVGGLLFALGIATYAGGRRVGVAAAAVIVGVIGLFSAILGFGVVKNQHSAVGTGDVGPGVVIGTLGILIALAGGIQVLSKRRR
ncbi:MAG: hypothetical protein JWM34_985 [Ilumatobacteraceae bacterium]|nr:hypothetical protein [Ilumatobacteraceae bacterium]